MSKRLLADDAVIYTQAESASILCAGLAQGFIPHVEHQKNCVDVLLKTPCQNNQIKCLSEWSGT